jgi:hypothetical protein
MDTNRLKSAGILDGLKPVAPNALDDFERAMNEEVIPDIIKAVEERRLLVAKSRQRQLKC